MLDLDLAKDVTREQTQRLIEMFFIQFRSTEGSPY